MSNELKLTGVIIAILPVESGTSKAGKEWKKQNFVIETNEQYPKKACFTLFGDKLSYLDKFAEGSTVDVKFNAESNEFNGKYFTNLNAYSIFGDEAQKSGSNTSGSGLLPPTEHATQGMNEQPEDSGNDLPF